MKKLMSLLCLVACLGFFGVHAKCINKTHVNDGPPDARVKSKKYICAVKSSDNVGEHSSFTPGDTCKNCGCARSMHDKT